MHYLLKSLILFSLLTMSANSISGQWFKIDNDTLLFKKTQVINGKLYKVIFYFKDDNIVIYDCFSNKNKDFQDLCDKDTQYL